MAATALATGIGIAATAPAQAAPPQNRAEQFSAAAAEFQVPESVLLAVSYLESRWQDHAGEYSTSAGFGPMHLTDADYVLANETDAHYTGEDARGDDRRPMTVTDPEATVDTDAPAFHTLDAAAELTGIEAAELRDDPAQNIRGGAALLASHYDGSVADQDDPFAWYTAVAQYTGSTEPEAATGFADLVYEVIATGATAATDAGPVSLDAVAGTPDRSDPAARGHQGKGHKGGKGRGHGRTDCPGRLHCEWVPAPYEQYGETDGEYGNHDKADRPHDVDIDYIVIHDTETSYTNTLDLVQNPTYLAWHYTLRSFDGHIAQHMTPDDIGWHAGNWSVNTHSLGLEHEGIAAEGSWFTEAMYASSAKLVRYLAHRFDIPLDRAHILGHENVPATTTASIPGMHWDSGPFWDWEHYFDLLHAPVEAGDPDSGLVTVAPAWDTNLQEFTGCDAANPAGSCGLRSASTVFVRSAPSEDAPLLNDIGFDPSGEPGTNRINDVSSRAYYGQTYAVAEVDGDWTAIWFLGQKGWIHNPADAPVLIPADGQVVTPKADGTPVYGVAYPEEAAYEGTPVPPQAVTPLPYTLDSGQAYSFGGEVQGEYFWAKTFQGPSVVVTGERTYYQVQVGGRAMYVDAADVDLT